MQQYLYEHLYSKSHNGFLWNVSTSLIDKTDGFQPKKREIYWMMNLKTLAPLGINVESTVIIIRDMFYAANFDWTVFGL